MDFAWVEVAVIIWLGAGVPFFRPTSSSDLLSDLETEEAKPTAPLQDWEPDATAQIVLQEPNLDTIYMIYWLNFSKQAGLLIWFRVIRIVKKLNFGTSQLIRS